MSERPEAEVWNDVRQLIGDRRLTLGPHWSFNLRHDPKRLAFVLSRYKFAAKMACRGARVLELGCSDGIGTPILAEHAAEYLGVDLDAPAVASAQENWSRPPAPQAGPHAGPQAGPEVPRRSGCVADTCDARGAHDSNADADDGRVRAASDVYDATDVINATDASGPSGYLRSGLRPGLARAQSPVRFEVADFLGRRFGEFGAVVSLDVVEHIMRDAEALYFDTVAGNLAPEGVAVVGTPNVASEAHASPMSRAGHVNLFDGPRLAAAMGRVFHNVFSFGINDEVVHTGFGPMCHYLVAVGCNRRE